jgi:uncharacterized membrane protein
MDVHPSNSRVLDFYFLPAAGYGNELMRLKTKNFHRSISFLACLPIVLFYLSSDVPASLCAEFFALGDAAFFSEARAVSANGEAVVGRISHNGSDNGFVWNLATGLTLIDQASVANGISGDGQVVVGQSFSVSPGYAEPFYWTSSIGTQLLGGPPGQTLDSFTYAAGASYDGSVIVGATRFDSEYKAFRYTVLGGFELLSESAPFVSDSTAAVSGDGQIIVGYDSNEEEAFRWTSSDGKVFLGSLLPDTPSNPTDISNDGTVVVGDIQASISFRWTTTSGMSALGPSATPGPFSIDPLFSYALGTTNSGEAVVGSGNGTVAYVWTEGRGMESLQLILENRFGLADELTGWNLEEATDISPDGRFIVGNGTNPDGNQEAWLVHLDRPIFVPELSSMALMLLAAGTLACRRRAA